MENRFHDSQCLEAWRLSLIKLDFCINSSKHDEPGKRHYYLPSSALGKKNQHQHPDLSYWPCLSVLMRTPRGKLVRPITSYQHLSQSAYTTVAGPPPIITLSVLRGNPDLRREVTFGECRGHFRTKLGWASRRKNWNLRKASERHCSLKNTSSTEAMKWMPLWFYGSICNLAFPHRSAVHPTDGCTRLVSSCLA